MLSSAPWAPLALQLAQQALQQPRFLSAFSLYAFKVLPSYKLVRVRLDKLSDL